MISCLIKKGKFYKRNEIIRYLIIEINENFFRIILILIFLKNCTKIIILNDSELLNL